MIALARARTSSSWTLVASLFAGFLVLAALLHFTVGPGASSSTDAPEEDTSLAQALGMKPSELDSAEHDSDSAEHDTDSTPTHASPFERPIWMDIRAAHVDSLQRPTPWSRYERPQPEDTLAALAEEVFQIHKQRAPSMDELHVFDVNGDGRSDLVRDGSLIGARPATTVYVRNLDGQLQETAQVQGNALSVRLTPSRDTLHLRTVYTPTASGTTVIDEHVIRLPDSVGSAPVGLDSTGGTSTRIVGP